MKKLRITGMERKPTGRKGEEEGIGETSGDDIMVGGEEEVAIRIGEDIRRIKTSREEEGRVVTRSKK